MTPLTSASPQGSASHHPALSHTEALKAAHPSLRLRQEGLTREGLSGLRSPICPHEARGHRQVRHRQVAVGPPEQGASLPGQLGSGTTRRLLTSLGELHSVSSEVTQLTFLRPRGWSLGTRGSRPGGGNSGGGSEETLATIRGLDDQPGALQTETPPGSRGTGTTDIMHGCPMPRPASRRAGIPVCEELEFHRKGTLQAGAPKPVEMPLAVSAAPRHQASQPPRLTATPRLLPAARLCHHTGL